MIANAEVEASEKLKNLDREISKYEAENQLREEKLRVKESLSHLVTKAGKVGFEKVKSYSFVEKDKPVAAVFDEFHN